MEGILKSDIFFVITTIAIVVISIGVAIALVYVIRILRDVRELSQKAKDEGERILDDVKMFREEAKGKGAFVAKTIMGFMASKVKKSKVDRKKDTEV